jgi:immune inhibitor A
VTVNLPSSVATGNEVDVLTMRLASQPEAQVWCTPGSSRLLECSGSPVFADDDGSDSGGDVLLNVTYRLLALAPQGACVKLIPVASVTMDANSAGALRDGLRQLTTMSVTPPAPRVGTVDPVVLLVDFSDRPAQPVSTPAFFASLLFASTGQRKSLRDYYNDTSYGKLDVAGDVFPASGAWLRLPQPFSYYNSYDAAVKGNSRPHFDEFLADVRALADLAVDFSQHDANGDGVVDGVIIVYAGKSDMPWAKGLWPCCTTISWTVDGLKTAHTTVQNEYDNKPGDATIGVFCHEFAHSLGTRDLYSYDTLSGVGSWSLMSGNSELLDPWHRSYLGWAQPTDVTQDGTCTVKPAEGASPDGTIVRIMLKSPDEYLLLESRQQQGWGSSQPGHGLLVWHVDETTSDNDHPWYPGNTANGHLFEALVQADGFFDLEMGTNSGDAGDCWHAGQTLSPNSVPSSLAYDRTGVGVQIDGIQEVADGAVSFAVHLTKNVVIAPGAPALTATAFSRGAQLRWAAAAQGSFPRPGI